jgi:hypothetical protein
MILDILKFFYKEDNDEIFCLNQFLSSLEFVLFVCIQPYSVPYFYNLLFSIYMINYRFLLTNIQSKMHLKYKNMCRLLYISQIFPFKKFFLPHKQIITA